MSTYLRTAIEDALEQQAAAAETLAAGTGEAVSGILQQTIEGYRSDPATGCISSEQAGAAALVRELLSRYRGRGNAVPVCRPVRGQTTGYSLHAEGRAIDWFLNANDPAEAAEAQRILDWLLAGDAQGNQHAVARRMGVQELIWNRRIWSARRHAEGWRAYGGASPHTDHIHIGLNRPGARAQTSYWTSRTGAQPAPAVPGPPAAGSQVAAGATTTFASAADIDAFFRGRTGRTFLDWFHETQAGRGDWARKDVRLDADTRRRFTQVWDRIPDMFGTPSISLEQFVALQSIFINELGGGMAPVTERMGRTGHPGMAYLFDAIPNVKRSYNQAPNRTGFQCFNDAAFIAAHGGLSLGSTLARTTDRAWDGQSYPPGHPTDMAAAGFVAQADFCKFRGRGLIQTTWRSAYRAIVGFVQGYSGTNAKVLEYRRRWTGEDPETVLTRSTNADWDDLFQSSGYVIACAGIKLHSRGTGYLALSANRATRLGTGSGSFHNMGRRISGSSTYAALFKRRCLQILNALAPGTTAPSTAHTLENGQPYPSSRLQWDGAAAEQLDFMRRVYDAHVRRSSRVRSFVADVPDAELGAIEGGARARTAAAGACVRLLADARAALADARRAGDGKALAADRVSVVSAYRPASQQFRSWQVSFRRYYEQTRVRRTAAAGGDHGAAAADLTARHIGSLLGAPGYSLHNNGLAIDFGTRQSGVNLGASASQRAPWRASWLWDWMVANASRYGFFQNTSIDEPWHWEYRGTQPAAAQGVATALEAPAGSAAIAGVPLLAAHHDRGPDLVLRWNHLADPGAGVDVVVHLHGFSSDRHLDLSTTKLPLSGLDFTPPQPPSGVGAPAHAAWAGRSRPTLLVLPRGRARPGHSAAYDFPALTEGDGFAQLVQVALRELGSRHGGGRSIPHRRIILTAHSGGGSALNKILARTSGTPFDPHEVHVFDALYGEPSGLRGWLSRRLGADVARLRTGVADPAAYLRDQGGALRVFYTHGSTEPHSLDVQRRIDRLVPQGTPSVDLLRRRYRAELSRVGHSLVAYWYGGPLLADAGADRGPASAQGLAVATPPVDAVATAAAAPATSLGATTSTGRYWERALRIGLAGNTVEPLVDGPATFTAIQRAIETATGPQHYIYLLSWWCDPWVYLNGPGTSMLDLFARAGERNVQIRVLLWDAPEYVYGNHSRLHDAAVAALNRIPNCHAQQDAGGGTLSTKSHHQKLLVVKGDQGLIALGGGVDINADRLHDLPPPATAHRRDRPRVGWTGASGGSGPVDDGAPLHDVHARATGPTALPLLRMFLRRWYARSGSRAIDTSHPLRGTFAEPVPPPTGRQFVRVGETFAGELLLPDGRRVRSRKRDVQDIWLRSLLAARRFIYMEEQYLTNLCAAEAIRRVIPRLDHVTILIPPSEMTDIPGVWRRRRAFIDHITGGREQPKLRIYTRVSGPPQQCNRTRGLHLYVHSKMAVVDDELVLIGSANCNNRGWETDSELVLASFEDLEPGPATVAAGLRRVLWAEHLNQPPSAVDNAMAAKGLWDTAPSRRVCRYNPTGGRDSFSVVPDSVSDPTDRQSADPCCTLLRQC